MNDRFPWLQDEPLCSVLKVLNQNGAQTRVVGGAVRNALLGLPFKDFDLATTLLPQEVMARAQAAGFKAVPTGIEHGTVTVVAHGVPFEVTTLREDVATNGRYAVVKFGKDFAADARRRDFTINALSLSVDGQIHDTVDGLADITARRVRFIGDAKQRIAEDYLRILRYFRFFAFYGAGEPDALALEAVASQREGLKSLSRERIGAEMLKLLLAPRAAFALQAMHRLNLFANLTSCPALPERFERFCDLEAQLLEFDNGLVSQSSQAMRLAALHVQTIDDVAQLKADYRLSNALEKRLYGLFAPSPFAAEPTAVAARRLGVYLGRETAFYQMVMAAVSHVDSDFFAAGWLEALLTEPLPAVPIHAENLMNEGFSGADLGQELERRRVAWIVGNVI